MWSFAYLNLYIHYLVYFICSYRACYKYEMVNNKCEIDTNVSFAEVVTDITVFTDPVTGSKLFDLTTPTDIDGNYPNDTVCFFIIGKR